MWLWFEIAASVFLVLKGNSWKKIIFWFDIFYDLRWKWVHLVGRLKVELFDLIDFHPLVNINTNQSIKLISNAVPRLFYIQTIQLKLDFNTFKKEILGFFVSTKFWKVYSAFRGLKVIWCLWILLDNGRGMRKWQHHYQYCTALWTVYTRVQWSVPAEIASHETHSLPGLLTIVGWMMFHVILKY